MSTVLGTYVHLAYSVVVVGWRVLPLSNHPNGVPHSLYYWFDVSLLVLVCWVSV